MLNEIPLNLPMLRRIGPHSAYEDPISFKAVMLKVYLIPAVNLGTLTEVMVESLFTTGIGLLSIEPS